MSAAQESHVDLSLVPVEQMACAQVVPTPPPPPPPVHDSWQIEATSLTHCESHELLQQYESALQIWAAQVSHEPVSAPPVEQIGWLHVEPPPPPPMHVPALQL